MLTIREAFVASLFVSNLFAIASPLHSRSKSEPAVSSLISEESSYQDPELHVTVWLTVEVTDCYQKNPIPSSALSENGLFSFNNSYLASSTDTAYCTQENSKISHQIPESSTRKILGQELSDGSTKADNYSSGSLEISETSVQQERPIRKSHSNRSSPNSTIANVLSQSSEDPKNKNSSVKENTKLLTFEPTITSLYSFSTESSPMGENLSEPTDVTVLFFSNGLKTPPLSSVTPSLSSVTPLETFYSEPSVISFTSINVQSKETSYFHAGYSSDISNLSLVSSDTGAYSTSTSNSQLLTKTNIVHESETPILPLNSVTSPSISHSVGASVFSTNEYMGTNSDQSSRTEPVYSSSSKGTINVSTTSDSKAEQTANLPTSGYNAHTHLVNSPSTISFSTLNKQVSISSNSMNSNMVLSQIKSVSLLLCSTSSIRSVSPLESSSARNFNSSENLGNYANISTYNKKIHSSTVDQTFSARITSILVSSALSIRSMGSQSDMATPTHSFNVSMSATSSLASIQTLITSIKSRESSKATITINLLAQDVPSIYLEPVEKTINKTFSEMPTSKSISESLGITSGVPNATYFETLKISKKNSNDNASLPTPVLFSVREVSTSSPLIDTTSAFHSIKNVSISSSYKTATQSATMTQLVMSTIERATTSMKISSVISSRAVDSLGIQSTHSISEPGLPSLVTGSTATSRLSSKLTRLTSTASLEFPSKLVNTPASNQTLMSSIVVSSYDNFVSSSTLSSKNSMATIEPIPAFTTRNSESSSFQNEVLGESFSTNSTINSSAMVISTIASTLNIDSLTFVTSSLYTNPTVLSSASTIEYSNSSNNPERSDFTPVTKKLTSSSTTTPSIAVSSTTTPSIAVSSTTTPSIAVSSTTTPSIAVSSTTTPSIAVSSTTTPSIAVSSTTTPSISVSPTTMLSMVTTSSVWVENKAFTSSTEIPSKVMSSISVADIVTISSTTTASIVTTSSVPSILIPVSRFTSILASVCYVTDITVTDEITIWSTPTSTLTVYNTVYFTTT